MPMRAPTPLPTPSPTVVLMRASISMSMPCAHSHPHARQVKLMEFLEEKIATLGTSACPPYHLAICIGGLSAEMCLKTVK